MHVVTSRRYVIRNAWPEARLDSMLARTSYPGKRFGIGLWLVSIIVEVLVVWQSGARTLHHSLWLHALLVALVTLPVCLWFGYVWGQTVLALAPPGSRRRRRPPTPP
jgi:hypothetical protein